MRTVLSRYLNNFSWQVYSPSSPLLATAGPDASGAKTPPTSTKTGFTKTPTMDKIISQQGKNAKPEMGRPIKSAQQQRYQESMQGQINQVRGIIYGKNSQKHLAKDIKSQKRIP